MLHVELLTRHLYACVTCTGGIYCIEVRGATHVGAIYRQRVDSSTQQIHTGVSGLARAQGAGARVGKQRIEVRGSHGQAGDGVAEQIELPGLRVEG